MIGHPFTGITAGEVGVSWTADLVIGASLLGAAALLVAGAWVFVTLRARSMRKAHIGAPTRLAQTATLNRVATTITAVTLTGVVAALAWRLLLQLAQHP
ncbi:hypothetical protein [Pseudoclavibacter sp. Z016]|uniref:hypothetical protein n=1 Tax=Pseudoclavibacter sp. Z016 TaxID=2080581 RepID=UPI000CE7F406|nr:hypothetical protein [Pseudoclavibacter sp. Z016]PPF74899.1 hypothetical protein C5B99_12175 [Pseudoclavibacter sp. Z016]